MTTSFKQFLLEGGNANIDNERSDALDLTVHDRDALADKIKASLRELNSSYEADTGSKLWPRGAINDGTIFSGSTKHFLNSNISAAEFTQHKKKVGDIDTMVPSEKKAELGEFLKRNVGERFANLTLKAYKLQVDQYICIFRLDDPSLNVQVDLELVKFERGLPTEWASFSHSSGWNDIKNGVKGAFHKHLLMSLNAHKVIEGIEQMVKKQKEFKAALHSFSVKGLQHKYEKIGHQEGQPLVKALNTKNFIQDFDQVFEAAFDHEPTKSDIEAFWTFDGMLGLIKKYLKRDDRQKVLDKFASWSFGKGAQGLYVGDAERDKEEKMVAINRAQKILGLKVTDLDNKIQEYYKNFK